MKSDTLQATSSLGFPMMKKIKYSLVQSPHTGIPRGNSFFKKIFLRTEKNKMRKIFKSTKKIMVKTKSMEEKNYK